MTYNKNTIITKAISIMLTMVVMLTSFFSIAAANPANAASANSAGGYSIPATINMKVGESKTITLGEPSNSNLENVAWQWSPSYVDKTSCTMGSYWGKTAKLTIKAKTTGKTYIYATVRAFNKKGGNCIGEYQIRSTVNITKATSTSTSGNKKSTTTSSSKSSSGTYLDVSSAYTELNKFRTTKSVWQWNSNNKSKTYFNTKSSNTLKSLKRNAKLEATAKVRAKEIATKFSHTRPNGKSCFTAYPSGMNYRGENIAYGYTTSKSVTEAWKETNCNYNGQGHRRNMLNKNFNAVGIACYKVNGACYWVQCFGKA